jgi:DNA-binding Lrp family transcriptional regulator
MPRQFKKYANIPYSDNLIDNYLKIIKENPRLTTREIAKKLNCSYQTIKNLRSHLLKAKIVPHSLTLKEEYPEEKEEENETIKKLKEENEELKEQIKTLQNQINYANFEIIKRITYLEPLKIVLEQKINEYELKLQNTYDYKERLFLKEELKEYKLNYAKLIKELEILKSFLKSKSNVYAKKFIYGVDNP